MKTSRPVKKSRPIKEIVFSREITTISVHQALELVRRKVAHDPGYQNTLVKQLILSSAVNTDETLIAKLRMEFIEFCRSERITPKHVSDAALCYQGECSQDKEFEIAIGEFTRFARLYDIDALESDPVEFFRRWAREFEEVARNSQVPRISLVPVQGTHSSISPESSGVDDSDTDQWDLEVERLIEKDIEEEKSKRIQKRKKTIPGKLPNTHIGKLIVELAWCYEVENPAKVMRLLRQCAQAAEKPWWLGDPVTDINGEEAVQFETNDGTRVLRRQSCARYIREWKKSYLKKGQVPPG